MFEHDNVEIRLNINQKKKKDILIFNFRRGQFYFGKLSKISRYKFMNISVVFYRREGITFPVDKILNYFREARTEERNGEFPSKGAISTVTFISVHSLSIPLPLPLSRRNPSISARLAF